jgi:phosphoribosylcarboxyaminoimidazole (NCAIR) mutase
MLPKTKLVGFADKITVPAIPVPVSATVEGEVGALLVIVMVPGRLPAVVGANVALNVALAPTAIVLGVTNPLRL